MLASLTDLSSQSSPKGTAERMFPGATLLSAAVSRANTLAAPGIGSG